MSQVKTQGFPFAGRDEFDGLRLRCERCGDLCARLELVHLTPNESINLCDACLVAEIDEEFGNLPF